MFVTDLEVVNACLATLGEAPLNTMEDDHSFKAAATDMLKTTSLDVQKVGFWFNTEYLELLRNVDSNYVYVPQDVLEIRSPMYRGLYLAQRGNRLYNTSQNTYEWDTSVKVEVVRVLAFSDLPYVAAAAVRDITVMKFQHLYDGDATRYRELSQVAAMSHAHLKSEEVRQRKPNLLYRQSVRAVLGETMHGGGGMDTYTKQM